MWNIKKLQKRKKNRNKYIKQKIMLAINVIINVGFIKERNVK
jgi:hypothetical protein